MFRGATGMIDGELAVDANVLLAALLGGKAATLFKVMEADLITTENVVWETRKYIPIVASKIFVPEEELLAVLEAAPVRTVSPLRYRHALPTALSLIGWRDPKDAELLALALALHVPIWTNDRDFSGINGLQIFTTEQLVARLLT